MADDPERPAIDALLGLTHQAATAYGRPELAERIAGARHRLATDDVTVVVVGEFKQGKSTLVNALLGIDACPVDDDVASAVPLAVRHGHEPVATVVLDGDGDGDDPERLTVPTEYLWRWVAEPRLVADRDGAADHGAPTPGPEGPSEGRRARWAELAVPRRLLESGLVLVDTPGVGGLDSAHGTATLAALAGADAVLFVSDASQELTAAEIDALRTARGRCEDLTLVLTKADLTVEAERIADLDRDHLEAAGIDVPTARVASTLRLAAVAASDRALNDESGYPALVSHLRDHVVAGARQRTEVAARRTAIDVVAQLREPFVVEREALTDPEAAAARRARLEEAEARAAELQGRAARWQTKLADGIQDLSADIDHDLRERLRLLGREVDERIDAERPLAAWDELVAWLQRRATAAVAENHDQLSGRSDALAGELVELFRVDDQVDDLTLAVADPLQRLEELSGPNRPETTGAGTAVGRFGGTLMTGVRGSYGQLMMFSMAAGLIGIPLLNPLTVIVTLGMGRKAVRDDRQRRLTQERQQAKAACRRYLDDVSFASSKATRDAMRVVQRTLRDDLTTLAEEVQARVQANLAAARADAAGPDAERRRADVEAELGRLDALADRLAAVGASTPGSGS